MPPPELSADAPVVHVVDPGEPARAQFLRMHLHPTVAHRVARGLGQRADLDEPLFAQPRLDHVAAARTVPDAVQVRPLLLTDPALGTKCLADGDARLEPVQAIEL